MLLFFRRPDPSSGRAFSAEIVRRDAEHPKTPYRGPDILRCRDRGGVRNVAHDTNECTLSTNSLQ